MADQGVIKESVIENNYRGHEGRADGHTLSWQRVLNNIKEWEY